MARPRAIKPIKRTENFINWCNYGEPGVGKSVLAGSSPKALILANDSDEISSPAEWGSNADVWVLSTLEDFVEAYEYMRMEGCQKYEWVWLDNLTLHQDQFMDALMEELVKRKPNRSRWVPDMYEYLVVQNQVATYVRYFKALPVHFGWTAHVMSAEDNTGNDVFLPMIQGKQGEVSQKLCGYMNLVSYMKVVKKGGKEQRKIYFNKRGSFYAKSRFRGLQGEMSDPTVTKVMDAVRSQLPTLGQSDTKTGKTTTKRKKVA